MPSGKETIVNKALSGSELKEIIRRKLDRLMDNEGLLNAYVAYGRVGFTLNLKLHLDNMMQRESEIEGSSDVGTPGTEAPPLTDPSPEAIIAGTELDYSIDSPNAERLRHELPVVLDVKQPDGTISQQTVKYPKEDAPEPLEGNEQIRDTTPLARAAWKK
jgi:hypothetical protein